MLWIPHDLRSAGRMLARRPGLTAIAVLTLALGIGANSTMFSVVHGVLLQPLPYDEPERLALVYTRWENFPQGSISIAEYFDFVDQNRIFEDFGLYRGRSFNVTEGAGEPERVQGAEMTPSVFDTLRAEALFGRTFAAEEGEAGGDRVLLLSHGIWQRRFGGTQDVLGRQLDLDGTSYTVAGVMPPGFAFPYPSVDIWAALGLDRADMGQRGNHSYRILARLQPEMSQEAARAELDVLAARLMEKHPDDYPPGSGFGFFMVPLTESVVGKVRGSLLMLLAAVGLVLLIACANVANLLLVRASSRRQEIATRTALGATQGQVVRQLLIESLALGLMGGVPALLVAAGSLQALRVLQPAGLPRIDAIALDGTALAFTFGMSVLTGVLFGLAPALQATRKDFYPCLREGARESDGARHHRVRDLLVVAEVSLAVVLLVGAGLLIRSYQRLQQVDPGFATQNVLTTGLSLSPGRYADGEAVHAFYHRLRDELAELPGVVSAGAISNPPLSGWNNDNSIGVEGYDPPGGLPEFIERRVVTPRYFETLEIPILLGRDFNDSDRADGAPVIIVSRSLAKKYWAEEEPIGRRIKLGGLESDQPWMSVVGVVGDVRHEGLHTDYKPMYYLPLSQHPRLAMTVMTRTAGDVAGLLGTIRRQVLAIDALQPVYDVRSMADVVAESTAGPRFNFILLGVFAVIAMALAAIGIYGVISYSVSQRTREIGIRMALGAVASDVLANVLGRGMALVAGGLLLGLLGSWVLSRLMAGFLFQVSVHDPAIFVFNTVLLLAVAFAACLIPAQRATRVDPTVALRYE